MAGEAEGWIYDKARKGHTDIPYYLSFLRGWRLCLIGAWDKDGELLHRLMAGSNLAWPC